MSNEALFAVVHVAGHQYKVTVGDVITTQRLVAAEVGERVQIRNVLMVGSARFTTLGTPLVADERKSLQIKGFTERHMTAGQLQTCVMRAAEGRHQPCVKAISTSPTQ